jgi:hypothetical protein
MNQILSKIFGSAARLKIMRLFLLNPDKTIIASDVSRRARVNPAVARKETALLSSIGFLSKKSVVIKYPSKNKSKKPKIKRVKKDGWLLDSSFSLMAPLKKLILNSSPLSKAELIKKISRAGNIKLIVAAGAFIMEDNSRVDLLVVGDKIKKGKLERVLKDIESEVGKELHYAIFGTEDFQYRLNVYDKFIRDILDYPHEKILNKINI